jgi:hypothetical protein
MSESSIPPEYIEIHKKISSIIESTFQALPNKSKLPKILQQGEVKYGILINNFLLMVYFIEPEVEIKIKSYYEKYKEPFPGLIAYPNFKIGSAFKLEKARNNYFKNNQVTNMYSFDIGKDCTFILENHKVVIKDNSGITIDYLINLSYVMSFGDEINLPNVDTFFDQIIKYSIKLWDGDSNDKI